MAAFIRAAVFLFAFIFTICAQVNVTTYQYDATRAGANTSEVTLNRANVNVDRFGKLFSYPVDGAIYGQPLYVANVAVPGAGTHNIVYVATENDSVYAFDADSGASGAPLWQDTFANAGAQIIAVPAADTGCEQIAPEIGITSTPVIDTASGTIFVVAMTREASGNSVEYVHRLHALDLATGAEKGVVAIEATYPGRGEGGSTLIFNARSYKQRPGLLLLNGVVYTAWSSHCDIGRYHGWLIGYDSHTLAQVAVYNNTPNGNMGSFWNGGAAPAADASGNIYVVAGNGTFDNGGDLGESYIKLSTSNGFSVADYFTPYNYSFLNDTDADVGSAGVVLIGDEAGSAAHPHLMTGAGKEGRIYLLDRDNMGKLQQGSDSQIVQSIPGALTAMFGNPAYFNHTVYYCGAGNRLAAYTISNAQMSSAPISQSDASFRYPCNVPTISANGTANAIVWALDPAAGLRAWDASDLTRELWNAGQNPERDSAGATVKYSVPTVANGKVYAGTADSLAVYGLLGPDGAPAVSSAASGDVGSLAPGALVSIYSSGSALTASTDTASSFPIPFQLGGATVSIGGRPAPILFASPGQLNVQVPFDVPPGNAVIEVSVNGNVTATTSFNILSSAPGVFMLAQGRAAVVNQNGSVNSGDQPAPGSSVIAAYCTGLGTVGPAIGTGQAAPDSPLSWVTGQVTAMIGSTPAQVQFAGLAPGFAGLYQVNILVPQLAAGQYALTITVDGKVSNIGTIAVD